MAASPTPISSPRCAPPSRPTSTRPPSRPRRRAEPLFYTWRDLDRASAMHRQPARLARSAGRRARRGAGREVGRSADAVPGGAARRARSTCRSTPPTRPARSTTSSATPSRAWWSAARATSAWLSTVAFKAGTQHVFTLERRPQRQLARTRGAGTATVIARRTRRADELAAILYTSGHHRAQQGRDADARQPAVQRARR